MTIDALKARLTREEDRRNKPYDDATGEELKPGMTLKGNLTVGVGWNLSSRPLPDCIIDELLDISIKVAIEDLSAIFPTFHLWTENRQLAMIDLIFALGKPHFLEFRKMIAAAKFDAWELVHRELLDSVWADQTDGKLDEKAGKRAEELADLLLNG